MKFAPETEIDFLKHEYFVQWVHCPTKESTEYWNRWISGHPEKADLLRSAYDLLLSFKSNQSHTIENSAYYKILDALLKENKRTTASTNRSSRAMSNSWFVAAAVVMLVIGLVGFFFVGNDGNKKIENSVEYKVESVPKGFKKTIILPDGSQVKLNSVSELKYPTQFSDTVREVYLTGEAFFEVTKNKRSPFMVHTENFSTRVLGTSFDIRSYENENSKHVAVLTGEVRVITRSGLIKNLNPLDITIYNQDKKVLQKSRFNPDALLSWRSGVIVFDHASFDQVTEYLSRWFGVDFIVEKGFNVDGYYTGRFDKEALTTVLQGISYSSHFSFRVEHKKVIISKPKPFKK